MRSVLMKLKQDDTVAASISEMIFKMRTECYVGQTLKIWRKKLSDGENSPARILG
jgi:hypothetical protein